MLQVTLNPEKLKQLECHAVPLAWSKWFLREKKIHSAFCGIYVREMLFREKGEIKVSNKINGISWRHLKGEKSWNGGKIGVTGSRRPLRIWIFLLEDFVWVLIWRILWMIKTYSPSTCTQSLFLPKKNTKPKKNWLSKLFIFAEIIPNSRCQRMIFRSNSYMWKAPVLNFKLAYALSDWKIHLWMEAEEIINW